MSKNARGSARASRIRKNVKLSSDNGGDRPHFHYRELLCNRRIHTFLMNFEKTPEIWNKVVEVRTLSVKPLTEKWCHGKLGGSKSSAGVE